MVTSVQRMATRLKQMCIIIYIHTYIARGPDMFVGLAQDDKDTTERTLLATNRYTVWKAPTHILLACVSMISLSIIISRFLACTK